MDSNLAHMDIDFTSLGLENLPDFECLCEICDCGCFEQSKQPHALNCKRFFKQPTRSNSEINKVRLSNSSINLNERPNPLAFSGAIELPKGVLSEYQCSFITNQDPKQTTRVKIKDNLSLFTDNGRPNEPTEMNTYNLTRVPLRSKALNRLNNMMPSNEPNNGASWYQNDFNFVGSEDLAMDRKPKGYNALDHYRSEYLRNFDEHNRGFVDSYSKSKGSPPLVSSASRENAHAKALQVSQEILRSASIKLPQTRPHDFRPVWVPKKYDGRNMFVSHIDSALFPDKERREFETQYNNNFDSSPEKRVSFDRDTYVGKFPSYKYLQNYENKLVPTMKWTQIKNPSEYTQTRIKSSYDDPPSRSIYQADFEIPKIAKKSNLCKAALVQALMRRDNQMATKLNKNQPSELKSILQKRYNDIETYNIY